ncbi:RRXRR domain-containing protein [Nonomuraea polychroma]|uniref:RRXRR domain-containing protein n=1 Tax=Nonomuraea polychroma TaxID=46176 RepID=UPI003D8DF256
MLTSPSHHLRRCVQVATFDVRQRTHSGVLPQPLTLESVGADNLGRDETAHRRRVRAASGVEDGRGETRRTAPGGGRHPDGAEASEGGRGISAAYVHTPLVIRLKDRDASTCRVPGVETSIDPGSQHTGIAVFCTGGGIRTGLFALQLDHRGARIRDRLIARAGYRRRRRSANLRYRASRFSNRRRPRGWLPPSLRDRVETTVNWINRLTRWAPHRSHRPPLARWI